MVILSENDYLDVKLNSLIADYDTETLCNLYQPIIGFDSMAVYFTLIAEAKNQKLTSLTSHSQLLNRMQMAPGIFVEARKRLEGVGLVRTFLEEQSNIVIYHYQLYSPKTPYDFFEDTLLFGMLIKSIGDTDANRFKMIYHINDDVENGQEISSTFLETYKPNIDDPAFQKALNGIPSLSRNNGRINTGFDYDLFFSGLREIYPLTPEAFTKKDMKEIERLAMLYGLNEFNAAYAVSQNYDEKAPKGERINFTELAKYLQDMPFYKLSNNQPSKKSNTNAERTTLGEKINLMERLSPNQYLSAKQNGGRPALSDLKIVDNLSNKYHLSNSVINVVIDYTLATNNNVLSWAYCDKLGASLARENIQTAIDAMNYFIKSRRRSKKDRKETKTIKKPAETKQNEGKAEKKSLNWDAMLDDMDDTDGGNTNGKA